MAILDTALDPRAPSYLENRSTMQAALSHLETAHAVAIDGGGEKAVTRHHARGKLLPRERIELLVDRDSALLELGATTGPGLVSALGVVEDTPCLLIATDPTIEAGPISDGGARKLQRALQLAELYRLPAVLLLESPPAGATPNPAITVPPVTSPTLCALFGPVDQGLVMLPDLAHHRIAVQGQAHQAHHDLVAEDERDALRLLRQTMRRLTAGGSAGNPPAVVVEPKYDAEELLAVASADPGEPSDVVEVLARVLDGSEFDQFRPGDPSILAGFGAIHGYRVAVLANLTTELPAQAVPTGVDLLRLAEAADLPVLLLANPCTGPESAGDLLRALSRSDHPRITLVLGADPAQWALSGGGFRFRWPIEGSEDVSDADPLDGVLDPRDTRAALGICLSIVTAKIGLRGWSST